MKTLICATVLILSLATAGKSQTRSAADIFTITVYESMDPGYNKIFVYDNTQLLEEIKLEALYYKVLAAHQPEINKVLLKYGEAGYHIVSEIRGSFAMQSSNSVMVTTYRLEKKTN